MHLNRYVDSTLTVPNVLTTLRILIAVVAAVSFAAGVYEKEAVVLCIVATLLDAFDGWYARTFSQCSKLGEHLDPLADKLLMAVVYGLIAIKMGSVAIWALLILVGLREVGMTLFRSFSLRRYRKFIPANQLGKVKMIVQSTVGIAIIAYAYLLNGGFDIPAYLVVLPLGVILVLSYLSAGVYVRSWLSTTERAGIKVQPEFGETERMVVGK